MTLQQLITEKIDEYSGIQKLSSEMERLRSFTDEKKWFNNMIVYFNGLYNQIINVEEYAVTYRQSSLDTIDFLEKFNENRNEQTVKFLIDLINFKLQYVSGIRRIS
ncbi:MAG: hypothetical protein AB8B59_16825 [Maribacter sp.]